MIPEVQKKKLHQLLTRSNEIQPNDQHTFAQLNEIYRQYTIIIRVLHSKEPNIFSSFYHNDMAEIKKHIKRIKNDPQQQTEENLMIYKNYLESVIDRTIDYITYYLQQQDPV